MLTLTLFFFNDTATTEIYTLSYTTLFRSAPMPTSWARMCAARSLPAKRPKIPTASKPQMPATACTEIDPAGSSIRNRSEEHTSELQSQSHLVCRLLLEKKTKTILSVDISH